MTKSRLLRLAAAIALIAAVLLTLHRFDLLAVIRHMHGME
jgi:hypothetical protein